MKRDIFRLVGQAEEHNHAAQLTVVKNVAIGPDW
jgi:hypothetical protein